MTNSLPGSPAAPAEIRSWHKNCVSQTTSWSPCSKTCGRGLSLRVSNANQRCEMVKESRLCNLRPCEVDITQHIKVGPSARSRVNLGQGHAEVGMMMTSL